MEITWAKDIHDNLDDVKIARVTLPDVKNYDEVPAWSAQSEENVTLNLQVVCSSPVLGVEINKINKNFKEL